MASIFSETANTQDWTIAQYRTAETIGPVIRSHLAVQKAVTRVRQLDPERAVGTVREPPARRGGIAHAGLLNPPSLSRS